MFKHANETLRNPFWSVLAICITAILWLVLSFCLTRIPVRMHQDAFRGCAQMLNLQALDKSQKPFMSACMLRYGYNDNF